MQNEMVSHEDAATPAAVSNAVTVSGFWCARAAEIFRTSSNYFDMNVRNRIIADIRQFQSLHPLGSKYFTDSYKLKSKMFRAKTRAAIRKSEAKGAAAYFSTEDVVAVRSIDDNNAMSKAAAEMHKALLQYRLTKPYPHGIPWFLTCMGAFQESKSIGVTASFQDWDKELDRPDVTLLPVENYGFAPSADWRDPVNTSPWFYVTWPVYVKDVKARMHSGQWFPADDGIILSAAKQHSNDTIRQQRENRTDSTDSTTSLTEYQIVWVHENFEKIPGVGDVVYYTLGTHHLLAKPIPVEERYPQGRPVVIGFSIVEAHKIYPSSTCTITRGAQEEINEVANLRLDSVKMILNKRYIVARGQQVDLRSLTRNIPGSVTLANNPNADVRVVTTDDATASSYQEQDRLNLDFDDMAGSFSGSSVQSNRRLNETVGGMNLISADANELTEYELRTFTETWVERVLRQIVILEQAYETNKLVLELCGRNANIEKYGFAEVTDELLLQDVLLTVNVGIGAVNPQTQLERLVFAIKTLAGILGPDFLSRPLTEQEMEIAKEVFGKCGYKDGTRFLQKPNTDQDPMVQKLTQQIQQLQQALAAKNPPEVVAAQVEKLSAEAALIKAKEASEKVDAVVGRVEALFSAMQTAQTAVPIPGATPVADAIVRSAGFEDQDAPPVYPAVGTVPQYIPPQAVPPHNTSPMFPAHASRGMMMGIESAQV